MPREDVEDAEKVRSTSQATLLDKSTQVHHHKLQGIRRVMVEGDNRVRGPCQLPQPAGITGTDVASDLTKTGGHVVMQESVQRCLFTVTKAMVEQIHGQGIVEGLRMADRW